MRLHSFTGSRSIGRRHRQWWRLFRILAKQRLVAGEMVVSLNRETPIQTPKYYRPYDWDPQKGTPNFEKLPSEDKRCISKSGSLCGGSFLDGFLELALL